VVVVGGLLGPLLSYRSKDNDNSWTGGPNVQVVGGVFVECSNLNRKNGPANCASKSDSKAKRKKEKREKERKREETDGPTEPCVYRQLE